MTYKTDLERNEITIRGLVSLVNNLNDKLEAQNIKLEVLSERVNTMQKLLYGMVGIALTAVVYAILNNIGL